ncbi:hypothetical protein G5B40_16485 [Pikeienuella piscinae]|uniref:DUF2946 domain-containing protein n=1 Tax=Pikeienuella piscinae TaxID=2748098 RepID=A0A7L5C0I4_9RHOB|nr:hypothetical protein [Pikeienuella piscinae]QIE56893.1 hypothetical protein G5B40_16485 [Pikeienuella piscinae]
MIRHLHRWRRCPPAPVAVILALLLSFRAFAPAAIAAPAEGYVPICTGGEIVYVAVNELAGSAENAPTTKTAPADAPCPWFGLNHATLEALAGAPPPIALPAPPAPPHVAPTPLHVATTAFRPRAPPGFAS